MSHVAGFVWTALGTSVLLFGLHTLVQSDPRVRNVEIFTEMAYSTAAESFAANAALPAGCVLQSLVPGVVPRGRTPFLYGEGAEEAQRAGRELDNPFAATDTAALRRGAEVYALSCVLCHDAAGSGQGTIVKRGMVPPPSLSGARAVEMKDGEMFHIITRGQGNMPGHAAQILPEDRWKAILWVRELQEGEPR
jgi:mono/diheme cytochrome c family protein